MTSNDGEILGRENKKLKEENERLREELKKTKKEFEEYKAKHALTVTQLRKALNIREDKKKRRARLGARKGHKGYTRHIPERIDYIRTLEPDKCPHCHGKLSETQEIRSRYVSELRIPFSIKTTRYDIHRKYCPKCGKLVEIKPKDALPRARFGLNLMLFIMYLKLGLRLPSNMIVQYMEEIHGLAISDGEIYCILKQLSKLFGNHYEELKKILQLSRVKHTDTTSWRINAKNYSAWVFITAGVILYKITKRNNHQTAIKILGKKQKDNILIVDRLSVFRTLAQKAGFILQLCWAHILDDSKNLKKSFGEEGKQVHKKLKKIYADAKKLDHNGTQKDVEHLKRRIFNLTQRHYKNHTIWRFVENLYHRDKENLFLFVTNPNVNPTNCISERALRKLVIMRKISNGSRSLQGAKNTATLLTIIQTLRNNRQNLFQQLQKLAIASQS